MESVVTEKACAKLNLCLAVGQKTVSGYHGIKSVMQTVSLCDTLTAERAGSIRLAVSGAPLPGGENNIAYRAAALFFKMSRINGGARLLLEKRIPVAAGLGGGSADAAAVLRALNRLYAKPLTLTQLFQAAGALGADVPFCLRGGTAFAEGFGEKLGFLPQTELHYVLIGDEKRLSTAFMYSLLDEKGNVGNSAENEMVFSCRDALANGERGRAACLACNSFFTLAAEKCPRLPEKADFLLKSGAKSACITGKGPTVFGVFTDQEKARACFRSARLAYTKGGVFLCKSAAGADERLFAPTLSE